MDTAQYKRFCQQLDISNFDGNVDEACIFYFRLLQQLGVEVSNTKAQISYLKGLIGSQPKTHNYNSRGNIQQVSGEDLDYKSQHKKNQNEAMESESKQVEPQKYCCEYKGCDEVYQKESRLIHHKMLKHQDPPVDFSQNRIFRVEIRDSTGEGRRPTRF